jgi:hypothetical protein
MDQNERQVDRRKKMRFPMERELRYKVLDGERVVTHGIGVTRDISSNGASFRPAEPVKRGAVVELSISWPVALGDETPVRLVIFGKVVRSTGEWAACAIDQYEFRTQSRARQAAPAMSVVGSNLARWAEACRKGAVRATANA